MCIVGTVMNFLHFPCLKHLWPLHTTWISLHFCFGWVQYFKPYSYSPLPLTARPRRAVCIQEDIYLLCYSLSFGDIERLTAIFHDLQVAHTKPSPKRDALISVVRSFKLIHRIICSVIFRERMLRIGCVQDLYSWLGFTECLRLHCCQPLLIYVDILCFDAHAEREKIRNFEKAL